MEKETGKSILRDIFKPLLCFSLFHSMLYRTHHHPFLFPLNPFTSSSLSPHPLPTSSPSSSSSSSTCLQVLVQEGMECVEGAAKSSFRPEMAAAAAMKTNPHFHYHHQQQSSLVDDLWAVNNGQNAVLDNDFFVDDLLDFSNAVSEDPEELKQHETLAKNESETAATTAKSNVTLSPKDEFGSLHDSGLDVPADDLESLEWLSHFVEDSFSEYSLTCPVAELPPEPTKVRSVPEVRVETKPCFITPVQTKARTKRARTGGRVWSLGSPSLTESSSSSSSTTTTSSSLPCNPWLVHSSSSHCQTTQTAESLLGKPPAKKPKKKPVITESSGGGGYRGGGAQQPRRCSHCGVQKTPQWRAGPFGAKTLCNACGVRYKSGRLLPEYRPACSPTFSSDLHSNNHRKVLEMRRKKEVEAGLAPPVQSF